MALLRKIRPGPVAAIGFSAGGHLVASLAARAEERRPGAPLPLDGQVMGASVALPILVWHCLY